MDKVAGLVIFFNPKLDMINNLLSYNNQVDKLYIVDNSEKRNNEVVKKVNEFGNTEYIGNNLNLGVAAALNIGARKAVDDGYKYLLTMDQDSLASEGMVERQLEFMQSSSEIGIVAAEPLNPEYQEYPTKTYSKEVMFAITSGSLLNLSAYNTAGGFWEELFIDHVDHEYCLRLKKFGFKIYKTNEVVVYHRIGNAVKKNFMGHNFYSLGHPPVRLYYRTRNRFYVDSIYKNIFPDYVKEDRKNMVREFLEILLSEKDLVNKIKMSFKGYRHFKKHVLGKYNDASE